MFSNKFDFSSSAILDGFCESIHIYLYLYMIHLCEIIMHLHMYVAPSIAPQNFRDVGRTATSIMFQWNDLTTIKANGVVRNYTVICTQERVSFMVGLIIC